MKVRLIRVLGMGFVMVCVCALPLAAAPGSGRITGVVVDPSGTPQLGATVIVTSEQLASFSPAQLLTNDRGRFTTSILPAGLYSVKATLAGFLPVMDEHIQVSSEHTTILDIVLGSVFSSFEKMRRQPNQPVEPDDWTWVLRTSASTRAVLRWQDGNVVLDDPLADSDSRPQKEVHARLDLLSGGNHPGSIADVADAPATAFAYDMSAGEHGRLLMAGQFSYNGVSPSGGFSTEWIPAGESGTGPVMTLVVRESQLGPGGPVFRGLRISRDDQFALGDRLSIRYGAEFLSAGFGGTTSALRPRGEVALKLAENWQVSALVAAQPWDDNPVMNGALQNVMNALDDFPTLLMRNGKPVLENGWHEEVGVKRSLGKNSDVSAAIFHEASSHTAILGRGAVTNPDFLQDYYSDAFAYDAGGSNSVGGRLAFRRGFGQNISTTLVYSYAGAMVPLQGSPSGALREMLTTRDLHSLAGRVTATAPRFGTKFAIGYKWINGAAVSGMDSFADSLYHLDPYLSMEVHQPLPAFFQCHMEVMADVGNLLAQGYVPITTGDGQVELVPSYRYIRGGLSLQF